MLWVISEVCLVLLKFRKSSEFYHLVVNNEVSLHVQTTMSNLLYKQEVEQRMLF